MSRLEALRGGPRPVLLYGILALFSFPTLGLLVFGQNAIAYALDTFDLPRTGSLEDWLANGITLWNTHLTGGNALLAQQSNSPFAIDAALAFIIGPFGAYVAFTWLLAAVAGMSMHLYLRDSLRLSTVAVISGSIIYMFGFWLWVYGLAGPAIPLLFWLLDRAVVAGPRRWRFILAGSLVGAFVLYHSLSQIVVIVAAIQLVYLVFTAGDRRGVRDRILVWGGTWALAVGIYGPILVTQLVMLPISNRAVWDLRALYDPKPIRALTDTIGHYSQVILGVPLRGGIGVSAARYGTYFVGAIGLPLLALGIVGGRRDRRTWFLLLLLLAIPLVDLIGILAAPLQTQLGFLKSFQLDRIRHLYPFAVVAIAALGLDRLATTVMAGRPLGLREAWRRVILGASVIPLLIVMAVAAAEVVRHRHDLVLLQTRALGWAFLAVALAIGLACLAAFALAATRLPRDRVRAVGATIGVVLLVALAGERVVYAWGERYTDVQAYLGTWSGTLGVGPAKAFLLAQPGVDVDRVLSFGGRPNQLAEAGLLQVDGYQSITPLDYHDFFGALIRPQLNDSPFHTLYYDKWGNRSITFGPKVNPALVALSGARWLYVIGPDVPTVPGIVARFHDATTTVYEVPNVIPRAFVAGRVDVGPDPGASLADLAAANIEQLRATAYVAAGPDAERLARAVPSSGPATPAGSATIATYTPDGVVVDIRAYRPGILVLTDVMAPGWVAELDGSPVPIATVDTTFRGVAVDASSHVLVFRYVPLFTYVGFALAAVALVLAFAWAGLVRRHDGGAEQPPVAADAGLAPPGSSVS